MSPSRPRWKATREATTGLPWRVRVTWANRRGRLVCIGLEITELPQSPEAGLRMADLRRLGLDKLGGAFIGELRALAAWQEIPPDEYEERGLTPPAPGAVGRPPPGAQEFAAMAVSGIRTGRKVTRPRLSDDYLRRLAAEAKELWAAGDPRPNRTIARRRGVQWQTVRDHLAIATRRGYLPHRSKRNVPVLEAPDELPERGTK